MLPDDIQVLVPYKDLVALLELASKFEVLKAQLNQLRKEHDADHCLMRQTWDKIGEVERAL